MNQPDAKPAPNYVTCPCQHCGGKIEFDANQLDPAENTTAPCPHCALETLISVPEPKAPPVILHDDFQLRPAREVEREEEIRKVLMMAEQGNPDCHKETTISVPEHKTQPSISNDYLQNLEDLNGLGLCFLEGAGVPKDHGMAAKYFRQAAEQGHCFAQFNLGLVYSKGEGVPENPVEAAKWFRLAAEQGNSEAQKCLGIAYWEGKGVLKDSAEAVRWWRKAAERGNSGAQFNLGIAFWFDEGVPKDRIEAVKWFRLAAEQGDSTAQFNLGLAYDLGEGVSKDRAQAVSWWHKAAEQGYPDAQLNLGLAYNLGDGLPKDQVKAVKWYRLAAEQGQSGAQQQLAGAYALGEGVPQNYVEAYKWANLAAAAGMDNAKELRDTIVQHMTPTQIEEGQRLASIEALKIQNPTNHTLQERQARAAIPSDVRREVWRRDGGVCVKCGSRRNLEYDHIVPVSKVSVLLTPSSRVRVAVRKWRRCKTQCRFANIDPSRNARRFFATTTEVK